MNLNLDGCFPRYTDFDPEIPVWCLTPAVGGCLHRFFDTSPLSPSGRYMACLRLPQEKRLPRPAELATVLLVDLLTGNEREIATTAGWETQLGANINWGGSDEELFFNDVDQSSWTPVTVRLNPLSGATDRFGRGIYHVSPDGRWAISCALEKMRRTQFGYGVVIPDDQVPLNWELAEDDGLFLTDLTSGECRLLVSLRDLMENHVPECEKPAQRDRLYYGFHAKWAPTGDRILFTVRGVASPWALHLEAMAHAPLHFYIFTMRPDGTEIACATDARFWTKSGHHINFTPDGRGLTMNHATYGEDLYLVTCAVDGGNRHHLSETIPGSGHPTLHPDNRHVLTDCYLGEPMTAGDGTVPLRWIDLQADSEETIVRVPIPRTGAHSALRIDPHPAWDRNWRYFAFTAAPDGTRRVFIADAAPLLEGWPGPTTS